MGDDPQEDSSPKQLVAKVHEIEATVSELQKLFHESMLILDSKCTPVQSKTEQWESSVIDEGNSGRSSDSPIENLKEEKDAGRDEDEDGHKKSLNQDTFSFIVSANVRSKAFFTALFILAIKNAIFSLLLLNLIDFSAPSNKLGIPSSVQFEVLFSQFIAFGISVFTQNDLTCALVWMFEGYDPDLSKIFDGGTKGQWITALFFYFFDGALGIVATFFLVITSSTVLDVLLNFAAVEFVASLDDTAFFLAQLGFLGHANKVEADAIVEKTYTVRSKSKAAPFFQMLSMTGILLVILVGWLTVYIGQLQGHYYPQAILVQFDDEVRSDLTVHSGFYALTLLKTITPDKRYRYVEERDGGDPQVGQFAFCSSNKQWVFFMEGDDPCDTSTVLLKSSQTTSLDLTTTASDPWYVIQSETKHYVPMDGFYLKVGCETNDDCTSPGSKCGDDRCVCATGYSGYFCAFINDKICRTLEIDERFSPVFPAQRAISTSYEIMDGVATYGRPVFINADSEDLVFFSGLRWVISNVKTAFNNKNMTKAELAHRFTERSFNALSIASVDLMSDPVVVGGANDNFAAPIQLGWSEVQGESDLADASLLDPVDKVILLCSTCTSSDDENPCFFENECNEQGKCNCTKNGGEGSLCQVAPNGDGKCDAFFNTAAFSYDGGDCCRTTCISVDYTCGATSVGSLSYVEIGFPQCIDPKALDQSCLGGKQCYTPIGTIEGLSLAGVRPIVLGNGRTVAMIENAFDIVRIFNGDGSKWIQQGETLVGTPRSGFGHSVSIATLPREVVGKRFGSVPVFVAVGQDKSETWKVNIYELDSSGASWQSTSWPSINVDKPDPCLLVEGDCSFDIELGLRYDNGGSLLLTVMAHVKRNPAGGGILARVYRKSKTDVKWSGPNNYSDANIAALSGNGRFLCYISDSFATDNTTICKDTNSNKTRTGDNDKKKIDPWYGEGPPQVIKLSDDGGRMTLLSPSLDIVATYAFSAGQTDSRLLDFIPMNNTAALAVALSHDGSGAAEASLNANGGIEVVGYAFSPSYNYWVFTGHVSYSGGDEDLSPDQISEWLSISEQASYMAFPGVDSSRIYQVQNLCNKSSFSVSITLDELPADISWNLSPGRRVGNVDVSVGAFKTCDGCYDDNDSFGRAIIVDNVCLTAESARCLSFNFDVNNRTGMEAGAGYAAYLNDNDNIAGFVSSAATLPFAYGEGANATRNSNSFSDPECTMEMISCAEGEAPFVLAFFSDFFLSESSWRLFSGGALIAEANYSHANTNQILTNQILNFTQKCLPRDGCYQFVMYDESSDGICCQYGNGGFAGLFDGQEVFRGGQFGTYSSHSFGQSSTNKTCKPLCTLDDSDPSTCLESINCTIGEERFIFGLSLDSSASGSGWLLSSGTKVLSNVTRGTYDHLVVPAVYDQFCINTTNECQQLTVVGPNDLSDALIDYNAVLNGTVISNRYHDATYFNGYLTTVFGNRDSECGTIPTISAATTANSFLTLRLTFDQYPNETSWSFSDEDGNQIYSLPYITSKPSGTVSHTICINHNICNFLTVNDDGGDGICCDYGNGTIVGEWSNGTEAFRSNGTFADSIEFDFGNC